MTVSSPAARADSLEAGPKRALTEFGLLDYEVADVASFSQRVRRVRCGAGRLYLKEYERASVGRVLQSVRVSEHVRAAGVPAAEFLRTTRGAPFAVAGGTIYTLSRSVGPAPLASHDADDPSLPRLLAALQRFLRTANVPDDPPAMWDSRDRAARIEALRASRLQGAGMRRALDTLSPLVAEGHELHALRTPQGAVHGDFWPGNVIGDPRSGLGMIDFDSCHRAPLLLDVAQFVDLAYARCHGATKTGFDLARATTFAVRYAREAEMPGTAVAQLPAVLVAARISSALWIMERHAARGASPLDGLLANDIRTIEFIREEGAEWPASILAALP
jgi:Ser/Thr protein kinase RdoA (MazF antagonist)